MKFERHSKKMKPVSMVPLINVVFLLLIFFLVSGTVKQFEVIDVELPEASSGEVLDEGAIVLLLGRHDEVILNDRPIGLMDVQEEMAESLKDHPERIITVKADSRMDASRLISVMDQIKAAGGVNISLITQAL